MQIYKYSIRNARQEMNMGKARQGKIFLGSTSGKFWSKIRLIL